MTTLRTSDGVAVLRPARSDVVLAGRRGPDAAVVLIDPGGVVAAAVRIAAIKDRRRKEQER